MAFQRPDGRWFTRSPLDDVPGADLHASVAEDDFAAWTARGFVVNRRESHYLLPTTTVGVVEPPPGIELVTADRVEEDRLRNLDDELRQDVPGTDGWRWDAAGFREETYDSPHFDPAVYVVAMDGGSYVGLARVWMRPELPKLGFIGVSRTHRRRGIATALLSRAFGVLVARGVGEVTTEIDDTNAASRGLLEGLGARRAGGNVELVRHRS